MVQAVELEHKQKQVRFDENVKYLPLDSDETDQDDEQRWLSVSSVIQSMKIRSILKLNCPH